MRMKSIAFGTLELVGQITDLKRKDDWLIMSMRTTTPAGWELKAALAREDLWAMMKLMCRPSNLWYLASGVWKLRKTGRAPEY